ncbi:signal peptidase I [Undibacterium cyanobacteriorum]|uniref:Signal peptidase I n=1 Tax=Undibacterium cyanobacteriorum TaxID=3073561 RepID=A0ABY9RFN4_9BURK|nr:signal peptidase I [Undibacterium sp. 20NA77.5]WMW79120.1 signal peptidase I [Undibacterium sp. 20NA77.5]
MSFQFLVKNFALILFILLLVTGVIWTLDLLIWSKRRKLMAEAALEQAGGAARLSADEQDAITKPILRQPAWVEYTGSFFPVIAMVFVLRSFLFEPFKIPSGSMLPTLYVGDLILVNKYTYGIRLPIIGTKVIQINDPERGDVMVFKYPEDPSLDYIKRVVGVPGDVVTYKNKRLSINGVPLEYQEQTQFLHDAKEGRYSSQFQENLSGISHRILNNDLRAPGDPQLNFKGSEVCESYQDGFSCKVPAGHYFMMGDNRDDSQDSRFWGFVPDQNIVGKAVFIWMNLSDMKRIGSFQ